MVIKEFKLSPENWLIKEKNYDPKKIGMYESIFTLGNGYIGHRGCLEENPPGSHRGTYIAGIFDKSEAIVSELVNLPVWGDFSVWLNGHKFNFNTCKVLSHERILDLKKGILHRRTKFKDKQGNIILLETKSVVFAHHVRGALVEYIVTPINFSDKIKIISGLNGDVANKGYFPRERIKHLNLVSMDKTDEYMYLEMEIRDDKTKVSLASTLIFNNPPKKFTRVNRIYGEKFAEEIIFKAEKGKSYSLTKWVIIYTSREGYEQQLKDVSITKLKEFVQEGVEYHLEKHIKLWEEQWEKADIQITGDKKAQLGIRFNLYHLIIAKPHHDPTVGTGAKFLTGEGYRGHSFWDTEIFILPFFIYTFPEEARNILMYRYYTLDGAIKNAKALGYKGAKIAWESADTGEETTPIYLSNKNTEKRIWTGYEEQHIVSDVIYGLFKYIDVTGDTDFLYKYGAEIVFQTARFWLSRVEKRRYRYEIRKVIGPDEFHEHVDNNAFTNYMVRWHLQKAVYLFNQMKKSAPNQFKKLKKRLELTQKEIDQMGIVSKNIFFPYDEKSELIEEFEGYLSLIDITATKLDRHGLPIFPKGKVLVSKTQLIKQEGVVLLLSLFPDDFTKSVKLKNYEYYGKRTMHKSSLSLFAHTIVGLDIGKSEDAYDYFIKKSYTDLANSDKNTNNGIHAAATGATWMIALNGFAGMDTKKGILTFKPSLPKKWKQMSYTIFWKGNKIKVIISHKNIKLKLVEAKTKTLHVKVEGKVIAIHSNKTKTVKL